MTERKNGTTDQRDHLALCLVSDRDSLETSLRQLLSAPHVIARADVSSFLTDHENTPCGDLDGCDVSLVDWVLGNLEQLRAVFVRIREARVPAFALCGTEPLEQVSALENGADAVLTTPLIAPLLHARLLAWRRLTLGDSSTPRRHTSPREGLSIGALKIDVEAHLAYANGEIIALTTKEFDLLSFLVIRAGQLCTRDDILDQVWGLNFDTGTNMVDVYIYFLRRKLREHGVDAMLQTVRGKGYRLVELVDVGSLVGTEQ